MIFLLFFISIVSFRSYINFSLWLSLMSLKKLFKLFFGNLFHILLSLLFFFQIILLNRFPNDFLFVFLHWLNEATVIANFIILCKFILVLNWRNFAKCFCLIRIENIFVAHILFLLKIEKNHFGKNCSIFMRITNYNARKPTQPFYKVWNLKNKLKLFHSCKPSNIHQ